MVKNNSADIRIEQLNPNTELSSYREYPRSTVPHMVYKNGKCTYYPTSSDPVEYADIFYALTYGVPGFNGTIIFEDDYNESITSFYSDGQYRYVFIDKNLEFDLNGHTWNVKRANETNAEIKYFMYQEGNCNIRVKNGTLSCSHMLPLNVYGGQFTLENAKFLCDSRIKIGGLNGAEQAQMNIDRNSELEFKYDYWDTGDAARSYDNQYACGCFLYGGDITSYSDYSQYSTLSDFLSDHDSRMPTLSVDGRLVARSGDPSKKFDLTTASGSDNKVPIRFLIGKNAYLYAENGVAIFINNRGIIEIKGGMIIGETGIVMRSGHIDIKDSANPLVIGTGYSKYKPGHPDGEGTSDLNVLGNALVMESVDGYGRATAFSNDKGTYSAPTASIRSGDFRALRNVPIGSYSHLSSGTEYMPRVKCFVENGFLNQPPTTQAYVYETADNVDFNIVKPGSVIGESCGIINS